MSLDLTALLAALAENKIVALTAPPGTGKTTRVPPALLAAPWLKGRKILVLEPRRLAARRAAHYIATQLHEPVGERVGYRVRLESKVSAHTQIEFLTEGLLARRILNDPELTDVGAIIFDEFHERSLALELAFALTREVRGALRPDLRVIIMSATLMTGILPEATDIAIPAVAYPVAVTYFPALSPVGAIQRALREETGSILCFLPGEGEIRAVEQQLLTSGLPPNVHVCPLYAALGLKEQDAAVASPVKGERKIVLATSIAESSITIEGVRVVVDTGMARVPKYSPRNGLTRLVTQAIPQDRATQRMGRAGRTEPGICYRLWEALAPRTAISTPEILEADLTQTVLLCAAWGSLELPWLTAPPPSAWKRAKAQLVALGAVDESYRLTDLGRAMVDFPVDPALAALILRMRTIDSFGGALLAAVCNEGEKYPRLRDYQDFRRVMAIVLEERPRELWQLAQTWAQGVTQPRLSAEALAPYLCYAFPDHVARQRDKTSGRYLTAGGLGVILPQDSPLINAPWLLIVRMTDAQGDARVRWALPLDESDLARCPQTTKVRIAWDKRAKRLIAAEETGIGAIVLRSRPLTTIPPEQQHAANICKWQALGLPWETASQRLVARVNLVRKYLPEEGWPSMETETLIEALADSLDSYSLYDALVARLTESHHTLRELETLVPKALPVPSGRMVQLTYENDRPVLAVKLQEMFGCLETPTILRGRLPVVLHLLSPAGRPVQVTQDLQSFWQQGYAIVRKDLRGRYPKHPWPEDPLSAIPSARVKPRGE